MGNIKKRKMETCENEQFTKLGHSLELTSKFQECSLLLKRNRFLIFTGPSFTGKKRLAKAIAKSFEHQLSTTIVYFNDSIDSRSVFGSYQSSGLPGDFVWEPTDLAVTISTPNTLLIIQGLENCNDDCIDTILNIATTGSAMLPGNRKVEMSPTSRIIAVVTSRAHSLPRALENYHLTVRFTEPHMNVVLSRATSICDLDLQTLERLYHMFDKIRACIQTLPQSERRLSLRDFHVLCGRIALKQMSVTSIFMDVYDVFISHLSKKEYRVKPVEVLCSLLSVGSNTLNFIENAREVNMQVRRDCCEIGRVTLPLHMSLERMSSDLPFAPTRFYRILLEKVAECVRNNEFVLLSGETGIGKTRVIQELAKIVNIPFEVINLSLDTDAVDIIGGFKPAPVRTVIKNLMGNFLAHLKGHEELKQKLGALFLKSDYVSLLITMSKICETSMRPAKSTDFHIWTKLFTQTEQLLSFIKSRNDATAFTYVTGALSRAMSVGRWLLLDEINMGTSECLASLCSVINQSIQEAHPNFRLFACMNPATDAGKKKLPVEVRNMFTEFSVAGPQNVAEIIEIVKHYLPDVSDASAENLAQFYMKRATENSRKVSLRNLCRSLLLAKDDVFRDRTRSLEMALRLGFLEEASNQSRLLVSDMKLTDEVHRRFVLVEGVFFPRGPLPSNDDESYIRTASVRRLVQEIAAASASGRFPVLLEGETSTGKTSVITHLAKVTGHKVHRINNHEHTDIQEYIGSYVPNSKNHLEFKEGVLLQAVRNGDWVILDELNLAPTEVLEALNRLLDDNRELVVPERDIFVKAHTSFRLFATQNPAGMYGGRKKLSRAFVNRFVVINFTQPPLTELVQIVSTRCGIHETAAKVMVDVMYELRSRRASYRIFACSDGFMTLRDLFRWGNRLRESDGSDWRQELVNQGYFLLASKTRTQEDELKVQSILTGKLKRDIAKDLLFSVESPYFPSSLRERVKTRGGIHFLNNMALTASLTKMIVLMNVALEALEPVLLVGETGCGKTSVTYIMANAGLESINCHERTDVSDLLGSIRPTADGRFKWQDGVVVRAMRSGAILLIDEISLASDSVLERLNSVLEPSRTLLLSDSGASSELVVAQSGFRCVATMNPGGDHGKKELSKALRNRFTEIWCEFQRNEEEIATIVSSKVDGHIPVSFLPTVSSFLANYLVQFEKSFGANYRFRLCARDVVVAAEIVCNLVSNQIPLNDALYHTMSAVVWDGLPISAARLSSTEHVETERKAKQLFCELHRQAFGESGFHHVSETEICHTNDQLCVGPFAVPHGPLPSTAPKLFNLTTPTVRENAMRVARGFSANKPIMLEGSPGCGKSSLTNALALLSGNKLIRLNLSEQTEVSDLFGSDVPVTLPDGTMSFAWEDGPVLKAMKDGCWLLLDEMNLASQPVLEALNSCFDFRKSLYIAELGRTFAISADRPCRFFACQNPQAMGGGRHSLPKSFLNRFVTIYTKDLDQQDYAAIIRLMVEAEDVKYSADEVMQVHDFCTNRLSVQSSDTFRDSMKAFNLRDLIRLVDCGKKVNLVTAFDLVYLSRLHDAEHRNRVKCLGVIIMLQIVAEFVKEFPWSGSLSPPLITLSDNTLHITPDLTIQRQNRDLKDNDMLDLLSSQVNVLRKVAVASECDLLPLLVGPKRCGKSSVVKCLAQILRVPLKTMSLNSETDAQDLLGCCEQVLEHEMVAKCLDQIVTVVSSSNPSVRTSKLLQSLQNSPGYAEKRFLAKRLVAEFKDTEIYDKLAQVVCTLDKATLTFDWIDSAFVKAYVEGHWLLIKDVNCCSSAVLDRLNNCLERGGELVISEKADGLFKVLPRHPLFRVFFTMSPENGPISRAMKNRALELYISNSERFCEKSIDRLRLLSSDLTSVISGLQKNNAWLNPLPDFGSKDFSYIISLPRQTRLRLLGWIQSKKVVAQSLECKVADFYNHCWIFLSASFDPHLVCLFARLTSGIDGTMCKMILERCNDNSHLWREALAMDSEVDWSLVGVKCQASCSKRYVWNHMVVLLRVELCKPAEQGSLIWLAEGASDASLRCRLLQVFQALSQFVQDNNDDFCSAEVMVPFFVTSLLFIELVHRKWDDVLGDVCALKLCEDFNDILKSSECNFHLKSVLMDLMSLFVATSNSISSLSQHWSSDIVVPAYRNFAEVEQAEKRVCRLQRDEPTPQTVDVFNSVQEQMSCVLNGFKSMTQSFDYEQPLLNKFGQMLPVFPLKESDRVELGLVTLLLSKVHYPLADVFFCDLLQNDAVSPTLTSFWSYFNFELKARSLTLDELPVMSKICKLVDDFITDVCLSSSEVTAVARQRIMPKFGLAQALDHAQCLLPVDMIDPVLKDFACKSNSKSLLSYLTIQRSILSEFSSCAFGSDVVYLTAFDAHSGSALACSLNDTVLRVAEMVEKLKDLGDLCRPPNTKFFQLCHFLRSSFGQLHNLLMSSDPNIDVVHDALNSLQTELAVKFWEYPDVICPYIEVFQEIEKSVLAKSIKTDGHQGIRALKSHCVNGPTHPDYTELESLFVKQLSANSEVPVNLQVHLVNEAVFLAKLGCNSLLCTILGWLQRYWALWWENRQEKKSVFYEYKVTKRRENEGAQVDEVVDRELDEVEAILPDFSTVEPLEDIATTNTLTEHEFMGVANVVLNGMETDFNHHGYLPAMFLLSGQITPKDNDLIHLSFVKQLKNSVTTKVNGKLNVYAENDITLLTDCCTLLNSLMEKVNQFLEVFPENNVLRSIVIVVQRFNKLQYCHPQMYYTSQLEKVLEKVELWEANTCREYSLSAVSNPLKQVILEWRKLEVVCWENILDHAKQTFYLNAFLSSWPLVEVASKVECSDAEYEKNIVVLATEWLSNSSLVDFGARLDAVRAAIAWLKLINKRPHVQARLANLIRYYAQFVDHIRQKTTPAEDEASEKLKNLVKVARYTDLNLWSVKDSAQKVRGQICRTLHAYKTELNKPVMNLIMDSVVPFPHCSSGVDENHSDEASPSTLFAPFVKRLRLLVNEILSTSEVIVLTEKVESFVELVNTNVDYSKVSSSVDQSDKEKLAEAQRKMMSKELTRRRRHLADLRKQIIAMGVNCRRGLQIETDVLTERTVTGVTCTGNGMVDQQNISAAAARNVVAKLFAEYKHQGNAVVTIQLPAETVTYFKGTVDFGTNSLLNVVDGIAALKEMSRRAQQMATVLQEAKASISEEMTVDLAAISNQRKRCLASLLVLGREATALLQVISDDNTQLLAKDCDVGVVQRSLSTVVNFVHYQKKNLSQGWIGFMSSSRSVTQLTDAVAEIQRCVDDVQTLPGFCVSAFNEAYNNFKCTTSMLAQMMCERSVPVKRINFDWELLRLQSQAVYKVLEQSQPTSFWNRVSAVAGFATGWTGTKQFHELEWVYGEVLAGSLPVESEFSAAVEGLVGFEMVLTVVARALECVSREHSKFMHTLCRIVERVIKNGLVNPVPNKENEEGGTSEQSASGEASGLGEGSGKDNVSNEVEETGQVEGLEGDTEGDGQENEKPDDDACVEMEDDFGANLEDLDDGEGQDDSTDADDGQQTEPDWDVGEVAQELEKEIDPGLWENEANPENMDNEEQGAQQETGDMAAQAEQAEGKSEVQDDDKAVEDTNEEEEQDGDALENEDNIRLDDAEDGVDQDEVPQNGPDLDNDVDADAQANEEKEPTTETDQNTTEDVQESNAANFSEQCQGGDDGCGTTSQTGVSEDAEARDEIPSESRDKGSDEASGDCPDKGKQTLNQESKESADKSEAEESSQGNADVDENCAQVMETDVVDVSDENEDMDTHNDFTHDQNNSHMLSMLRSTTVDNANAPRDSHKSEKENDEKGKPVEIAKRDEALAYNIDSSVTYANMMDFDVGATSANETSELRETLHPTEASAEFLQKWTCISDSVLKDAFELAESLRIIIEPLKASKFQGDYRSGKRLNVRRLIPYIASNYRKNQIWMRRTKPAKRSYHVCLAVDDSGSMKENNMTEIACKTLCLLEKAFKHLDIGRISICKFGRDVEMLMESSEQADMDTVGPMLLKKLDFGQTETDLPGLLSKMAGFFAQSSTSAAYTHRLLIVVGDGRGTMSQGADKVRKEVQRLLSQDVTTLYLVVDNPLSSVFTMKVAEKNADGKLQLKDYMSMFPFPFYTVVQDASVIPIGLSEALKQWFDLAG